MRWRRESFWGQERTGRGRKTDREVGETTMKSVRERGSDGDGDQWNAATICVRCQTALKQILLFNEKRRDEKENSSAKKNQKKNTDVVEADEGEETLSWPEQLLLSRLLLIAWKNPSLPAHTTSLRSVTIGALLGGWSSMWSVGLQGVQGSPSLCAAPTPGDSGTNELTFLSNAHSHDRISESEQAENEKGRLIFLFPC